MPHPVKSDTRATRRSVNSDSPCVWLESLLWVLCGDSALDSMASGMDFFLLDSYILKGCSTSDKNLSLNNVNSANFLSDGMLDLNSWVHLYKVEFGAIVLD